MTRLNPARRFLFETGEWKENEMGMIAICDGCGEQRPATSNGHNWFKPPSWYERSDKDGIQIACCRECIDTIAEKTGKTSVVLPV